MSNLIPGENKITVKYGDHWYEFRVVYKDCTNVVKIYLPRNIMANIRMLPSLFCLESKLYDKAGIDMGKPIMSQEDFLTDHIVILGQYKGHTECSESDGVQDD